MIELKPVMWRLVMTQWQAVTAFGLFYSFYKWLLELPASWILVLLFTRILVQSFIYRHNLILEISNGYLSGPNWTRTSRAFLNLAEPLTSSTFLGVTTLTGSNGKEIIYRKQWYQPAEIQALGQLLQKHFPS